MVKEEYTTIKKWEKYLFDDDDFDNYVTSLWTESDHVFIYEVMRAQMIFFLQSYCYTGARIGTFVHNSVGEVEGKDGKIKKIIFKGLI